MGIYENPLSFGEEDQNEGQEQGFDAVQYAAEKQKERLKKQAEDKAEKDASDARKKAEKDARVAKKLADKVTKDLEKKSDKLTDESREAKEKVEEVKEAVSEMSDQIKDSADALEKSHDGTKPVEMSFTEGSEYIAELKEGEEAIFDLSQSAESVERTIDLADEVAAKAEALARARAALDEVVSDDMGVESDMLVESRDVFGEDGPEQDVRERLRHAWEPSVSLDTADTVLNEQVSTTDEPTELPSPRPLDSRRQINSYGWTNSGAYEGGITPVLPVEERAVTPISSENTPTPRIEASTYATGGYFAGKARTLKNELRRTDTQLRSRTSELQTEISNANVYPAPQPQIDALETFSQPEQNPTAEKKQSIPTSVERSSGAYDAVPQWIKQLEVEVKKGKVPEIKKWQKDVLKSQHPELLRRYEKLDNGFKQDVMRQTIEHTRSELPITPPKIPAPQSQPGDLPSFIAPIPAYMQTPAMSIPSPKPSPTAYEYAVSNSGDNSVFSNTYLSIVAIGGVIFGAILISMFGL